MITPPPTLETPVQSRGLTLRSVLIGAACVMGIAIVVPFNDYIAANAFMISSFLPLVLVLISAVLVMFVNSILHALWPAKALSPGELAVIFLMILVGCSVPTQGMLRSLIPGMVIPFRFGGEDPNFWAEFQKAKMPAWLYPVHSIEQGKNDPIVSYFYTRVPEGTPIPYAAWYKPLFAWGVFAIALWTTLVSLAAICRVQWAQNERLAFPLTTIELSLIQAPERGRVLNSLFRSRSFWITLVTVAVIHLCNSLHEYSPRVPTIQIKYNLAEIMTEPPLSYLPVHIKSARVIFCFLGATFFIRSRTAMSIWFTFLFCQLIGMFSHHWYRNEIPIAAWRDQHLGACIMFLAGLIWIGRRFYGSALRQALYLGGKKTVSRDVVWATRGAILGIAGMYAWLIVIGASYWMSAMTVFFVVLAHLITSRIVAETGMPYVRASTTLLQVFTNFPVSILSSRDVYVGCFFTSNIGAYTTRESLFTYAQHGLLLTDRTQAQSLGRGNWKLFGVVGLSLVLAYVTCSFASLRYYYTYATPITSRQVPGFVVPYENPHCLDTQPKDDMIGPMARFHQGSFAPKAHTPWVHVTIGLLITGLLQWLTWSFPWWPLQPVGYLASATQFIGDVWFSIMLGWLAKLVIVRLAGSKGLEIAKPAFIAMVFGEGLIAGVLVLVNLIMASQGYDYVPINFLPF